MLIDRRDFLKAAGATAGGLLLPVGAEAEAQAARFHLHKKVMEGRSICPYCSVGCGGGIPVAALRWRRMSA